jgi:Rab-like protein 2
MDSKKIVLFGDGCTGKSTMYHKICHLKEDLPVDKRYKATDEFDFKRISIQTSIGEVTVDLWDTAGQEMFNNIHPTYFFEAHAALLVI